MSSYLTIDEIIFTEKLNLENNSNPPVLTNKQRFTLNEAAHGKTQQQIANESHRSVHTVSKHWTAVIEKFNAKNMCEAVYLATKAGLLTILCGIFPIFIPSEAGATTNPAQHIDQNRQSSRRTSRTGRAVRRLDSRDSFGWPKITEAEGKNVYVLESSRQALFVLPPSGSLYRSVYIPESLEVA